MAITRQKQIKQFAKFSEYVLARHPDELGLVLDENGYIKIKEFIQAVTETDGWRHVRNSHINDMMLMLNNPPIEINDKRIRAKDRSRLRPSIVSDTPPKHLYACIKHKSYLSVLDNGVHPTAHASIICCKDREMAEKIGRRRDNQPIVLTVHARKMVDQGMAFHHAGDLLYLTDIIPADCFTGPTLPKEMPAVKKPTKKKDAIDAYQKQAQAGSFSLSITTTEKKSKSKKKQKDSSWKNNKKRIRKEKKHAWPDQ
jgi:putative RNA 2'-phosphotransferase